MRSLVFFFLLIFFNVLRIFAIYHNRNRNGCVVVRNIVIAQEIMDDLRRNYRFDNKWGSDALREPIHANLHTGNYDLLR